MFIPPSYAGIEKWPQNSTDENINERLKIIKINASKDYNYAFYLPILRSPSCKAKIIICSHINITIRRKLQSSEIEQPSLTSQELQGGCCHHE